MRKKLGIAVISAMMLASLAACGNSPKGEATTQTTTATAQATTAAETTATATTVATEGTAAAETIDKEEETAKQEDVVSEEATTEETVAAAGGSYAGTYSNGEDTLVITYYDGEYTVDLDIFRLASMTNGIGMVTEKGLEFQLFDPNGNPLRGVIEFDEGIVDVTFTDTTWTYFENGQTISFKTE